MPRDAVSRTANVGTVLGSNFIIQSPMQGVYLVGPAPQRAVTVRGLGERVLARHLQDGRHLVDLALDGAAGNCKINLIKICKLDHQDSIMIKINVKIRLCCK